MKLTKEEAIKNHRKMWGWLAENPTKNKQDWPGWKKCGKIQNDCFCCELAITCGEVDCALCPFEWPKTRTDNVMDCSKSYYGDWWEAAAPEERAKYAALIRDLPEKVEKKGEAEFAIGDWVKVLDKGFSFSDYVDFFPQNNLERFANRYAKRSTKNGEKYQVVAIGKHITGHYGLVYVLEKDNDIYLMHNGCKNGLPGLKLAEPPAPKFKIGDKVVPVSRSFGINNYETIISMMQKIGYRHLDVKANATFGNDSIVKAGTPYNNWYFLEADLIPYVERPQNFAPENKTVAIANAKYIFKDSVTVCVISIGGHTYKGIAKCAPDDTFDEEFGKALAEMRAYKSAFEDAERTLLGR